MLAMLHNSWEICMFQMSFNYFNFKIGWSRFLLLIFIWIWIHHSTILVIIFWSFGMFSYRSDWPQVKRNVISSIGNLVYELPHELPNDVRLENKKILFWENKKSLVKSQIWVEAYPSVQSPFQRLNFGNSSQEKRKVDMKLFLSCPVLLVFFISF